MLRTSLKRPFKHEKVPTVYSFVEVFFCCVITIVELMGEKEIHLTISVS